MVTAELNDRKSKAHQVSKPSELPWFTKRLEKAAAEVQSAVAQDDFLNYAGNSANRAVLSRKPISIVLALCSSESIEPSRIAKVSGSTEWLVRAAVARSPATPKNIVKKLAQDPHPLVQALAHQSVEMQGQHSPRQLSLLEKLVQDPNKYVRKAMAANPRTPASALESLASDKDTGVRGAAADNPHLPAALFEKLAQDKYKVVRQRVASNPSTPASILEYLAKDKNVDVRGEPRKPWEPWEHSGVAGNPNTSGFVLEMMARDKADLVRRSVADNPNTPAAVLEVLAKDKNKYVRYNVAENPYTTVALLK